MDESTVRRATPDDAAGIAAVHTLAWRQAYADLLPADYLAHRVVTADDRRPQLNRADIVVVVAEVRGEIVGFATVAAAPEPVSHQGQLYAIYLLAEHWGRGLGHRLHEAAMAALAELGFAEAVLWVFTDNGRTIEFYQRHGWTNDGAGVEVVGGRTMRESRFRRPLAGDRAQESAGR